MPGETQAGDSAHHAKAAIAKGLSELVQARQETARTVFKFVSQTSAGQPASGHGSA